MNFCGVVAGLGWGIFAYLISIPFFGLMFPEADSKRLGTLSIVVGVIIGTFVGSNIYDCSTEDSEGLNYDVRTITPPRQ